MPNTFYYNYTLFFVNTLLLTGALIFFTGLFSIILPSKNLIFLLILFELALLGLGLIFSIFSLYNGTVIGQIIVLILLVLGGTESVLGLSLLLIYYSYKNNGLRIAFMNDLKS